MTTVNMHDAKTHFSKLIARIESGEEIIIARAGRPVARLVPLAGKTPKRIPGTAKGRIVIDEKFFAPLPEEALADFEN